MRLNCLCLVSMGERITICEGSGSGLQMQDICLTGSASIEVWATEDGVTKKIVFSGDIENWISRLLKTRLIQRVRTILVMESRRGWQPAAYAAGKPDYLGDFTRILKETFDKGGKCCYSFPLLWQNSCWSYPSPSEAYLWREECTILLLGIRQWALQGRRLIEGEKECEAVR